MRGRAVIYDYFSMVLSGPPSKQILGLSRKLLPAFSELGEAAASGLELLESYAEKEAAMDEATILNLASTNYTTLFYIGLGSVPSSESVFVSPARLVKQEPWEKVVAFYYIRKYQKPEQIREPEDHISVELDFMRYMCNLALYMLENAHDDKLDACYNEQITFLDEHLLRWVPDFCRAVRAKEKYDETGLYTAAALLLPVFLTSDFELLGTLADQ